MQPDTIATHEAGAPRAWLTTRKTVHVSMLAFAFLLPFLTWPEAAGAAVLALLFNLAILPRLGLDLGKHARVSDGPLTAAESGVRQRPEVWTGILIYPISVLALILIYRHHHEIVAATWAIMALGDGFASVAGEAMGGPRLPWNVAKTWTGFVTFILAGSAGAVVLSRWVNPSIPFANAVKVCIFTAILGGIVESAPIALDDNLTVPLVCGAFMFCVSLMARSALDSNLPFLGRRLLLACAVNGALALGALTLRMANRAGAVTGFVLGVIVYLGWGWKSFLILFVFFVLGSAATRLGYARKAARGVAEARGGARGWREALANVAPGAFFALLAITTHYESAFLVALVAAFAEAAGDTVSSEIGQWLAPRAYLISTLRPVPAGENGGVSWAGSAAGLGASLMIVALGRALGLTSTGGAIVALVTAAAGNLFDSLLGATIERRGLVTNGVVNFAGTALAGALALAAMLR